MCNFDCFHNILYFTFMSTFQGYVLPKQCINSSAGIRNDLIDKHYLIWFSLMQKSVISCKNGLQIWPFLVLTSGLKSDLTCRCFCWNKQQKPHWSSESDPPDGRGFNLNFYNQQILFGKRLCFFRPAWILQKPVRFSSSSIEHYLGDNKA